MSFHQDSFGGALLEVRGQSGGYLQIAIGKQLFTTEKKMRNTEERGCTGKEGRKKHITAAYRQRPHDFAGSAAVC